MMTKINREAQALQLIFDFWESHEGNLYPTSSQVAEFMQISTSHFGNIRRSLFQKGLLVKSPYLDFELSDKVIKDHRARKQVSLFREITQNASKTTPAPRAEPYYSDEDPTTNEIRPSARRANFEVPVHGEVKGGSAEDISIKMSETPLRSIAVPGASWSYDVRALQVVGNSMIHEHILQGDYAIVERIEAPNVNELIVTRYLPAEYNTAPQWKVDQAVINNDFTEAYVIKFYNIETRQTPIDGAKTELVEFHRLGWRRNIEVGRRDGRTIYTRAIDRENLWRVIALYRETTNQ